MTKTTIQKEKHKNTKTKKEHQLNFNQHHKIYSVARVWPTRDVAEYSPAKTGKYSNDVPQFLNCACCKKLTFEG